MTNTGWDGIGASRDSGGGSASDLVSLDQPQTKLRLLLPPTGPINHWVYAISTPADGYRTWIAPAKEDDFFAINSSAFRLRAIHSGLAYDHGQNAIKILEQGKQIWEGIKTLYAAGKDLSGRDIIINKKGSGRQTEYTVTDLDPTPLAVDMTNAPDLESRYVIPTKEQVLEDLRQLGFTNPEQLFTTKPLAYEQAIATKVPFGKYKDKTMQEIYNLDSQYLLFLSTKIDRADVKEAARVTCNTLMSTDYELSGIAPSVDEVDFVAPAESGAGATTGGANVQVHTDAAGNIYHLIGNEWVLQPATTTPPAPPTPPAYQRPTEPTYIHNDGTQELWYVDGAWKPAL